MMGLREFPSRLAGRHPYNPAHLADLSSLRLIEGLRLQVGSAAMRRPEQYRGGASRLTLRAETQNRCDVECVFM